MSKCRCDHSENEHGNSGCHHHAEPLPGISARCSCIVFVEAGLPEESLEPPYGTCDWGRCDEEVYGWRYWRPMRRWLPVCYSHMLRRPKVVQ